jgi:uncharacterized protein YcfL
MNTKTRLASLVLLGSLLGACSATGELTYSGERGSTEIDRDAKNWFLGRRVKIDEFRTRQAGDRLQIGFDFVNRLGTDLSMQWSVDWFDADGFSISTGSEWQALYLAARAAYPVTITAPSPKAASWRIHVREADPVR